MDSWIDVALVLVAPAALGVAHSHLRWVLVCALAMGAQVFWKGYVRALLPGHRRPLAIALAPVSFVAGTLPYVVTTTFVFWLAI